MVIDSKNKMKKVCIGLKEIQFLGSISHCSTASCVLTENPYSTRKVLDDGSIKKKI